jgi:hypothetical protein
VRIRTSVFDELDPETELEAHIAKNPKDGLWVCAIVDPQKRLVHTLGVEHTEHAAIEWAKRCISNLREGLPEPADLFTRSN